MSHIELLPKVYTALRTEQSSQAYANQVAQFATKVNEALTNPRPVDVMKVDAKKKEGRLRNDVPGALKTQFPHTTLVFSKRPPFTSGSPNPATSVSTGGTYSDAYPNISTFGNPVNGHLSVGVSAGVQTVFAFDPSGMFGYTYLPDRWLLGDAISSTASILQLIDLPLDLKAGGALQTTVQFGWSPMPPAILSAELPQNYLFNALQNVPGSITAPLKGFVGVSAMVELSVSLEADGRILGQSQTFNNFLNLGINAEFPGLVSDFNAGSYLFLDFAFSSDPHETIDLVASIPYTPEAMHLIVETTVRLMGLRGGVNDPNAGYVLAGFIDFNPTNTNENPQPLSIDVGFFPSPFCIYGISVLGTTN